jgi:hypothetical protein
MKVRRPGQREQSMGMDDRISAANELKDEAEAKKAFLELLIKNEDLNGDAPGITKQVIIQGEDSLTPRQRFVFKRDVLRVFVRPCEGCGCDIPWDEKYDAYHERDGFCFDCHDGMTKDRDEWSSSDHS